MTDEPRPQPLPIDETGDPITPARVREWIREIKRLGVADAVEPDDLIALLEDWLEIRERE